MESKDAHLNANGSLKGKVSNALKQLPPPLSWAGILLELLGWREFLSLLAGFLLMNLFVIFQYIPWGRFVNYPPSPTDYFVTGHITERSTGRALSDATVIISGVSQTSTRSITLSTDQFGMYYAGPQELKKVVGILANASLKVEARAKGHVEQNKNMYLTPHLTVDLTLENQ